MGEVVGTAEEVDGGGDILRAFKVEADPAAIGQDVMGLGLAGGDDGVAHFGGEGISTR